MGKATGTGTSTTSGIAGGTANLQESGKSVRFFTNGQIVRSGSDSPVSEIVWSVFADDGSRKISAGDKKLIMSGQMLF